MVGASVAPPPLFPPVEPVPAEIGDSHELNEWRADAGLHQALRAQQLAATANPPATRKRVVLLPHPRTESTSTPSTTAAQEGLKT